jgi:type IV pilus assembly protein PilV
MPRPVRLPLARGFSLLEVMVAVIVICVGLLGIAKMQSLALSNTSTSRERAIAALQAAGMASAMHANRDYWNAVPGPSFQVTITSNPTVVSVPLDANLQGFTTDDLTGAAGGSLKACIASAAGTNPLCSAVQLAGFDLARWWAESLQPSLPNPSALITCSQVAGNAAPITCEIQISWSEKAVAMNSQETPQTTGQFETPTYTLYVQP